MVYSLFLSANISTRLGSQKTLLSVTLMQSYYLTRAHDLKCALMELSINAVVTGYKCIGGPNVIEIEPNERYTDGMTIHNCTILFKQGEQDGN